MTNHGLWSIRCNERGPVLMAEGGQRPQWFIFLLFLSKVQKKSIGHFNAKVYWPFNQFCFCSDWCLCLVLLDRISITVSKPGFKRTRSKPACPLLRDFFYLPNEGPFCMERSLLPVTVSLSLFPVGISSVTDLSSTELWIDGGIADHFRYPVHPDRIKFGTSSVRSVLQAQVKERRVVVLRSAANEILLHTVT
jgi:hypothetical protein